MSSAKWWPFCLGLNVLVLAEYQANIGSTKCTRVFNPSGADAGKLGQNHGCWFPGSLHDQVISSHDVDYTV